jgi:signal transduction histidine kinase
VASDHVVSRSKALRIGFGLVLGILLIGAVAAFRIQESFSRRSIEIQRKYFQQQEILTNLRRNSWMASITARDLLLSNGPAREGFITQAENGRREFKTALEQLANSGAPRDLIAELSDQFGKLWDAVQNVGRSPAEQERQYAYVQQEVVPRRKATGELLRRLEQASRSSAYTSEAEFAETRRSAARTLLILLAVDGLLGVAVSMYSIRYSERLEAQTERHFEEVSRAKTELERLSARLMEIQEQERTRLARELHDEIVQNLAVLRMEITRASQPAGAKSEDVGRRLDRARDVTERTMKTVRNIMLLLRPSLLDDLGLGPALQWLAEDFERRTGVSCQFRDDTQDDNLSDLVKTCVFRVVQEALHNAEKHAEAAHVQIHLEHARGSLCASVRDDGRGFNPNTAEHDGTNAHFGLIGMRERATGLRGSLTVESAPGVGTTIMLQLPLELPAETTTKFVEEHA